MPRGQRICPCGCGSYVPGRLVCLAFWRGLALPLKARLNGNRGVRRAAVKEVLKLAYQHAQEGNDGHGERQNSMGAGAGRKSRSGRPFSR